VLVSALVADGPPSRLLEEAIDGRIELLLPELVLEELHRVLTVELGFDGERARAACDLLAGVAASHPGRASSAEAVTGDPADDAILACAVEAGVDVLATGDRRHLLPVGEHHGVRVLTPQAALAELRAGD
jgi:predicted nucleic acid-binding protein